MDGNREEDFSKGSCSLTEVDEVPWWVVHLETETKIVRVAITNRGGSNGNLKDHTRDVTDRSKIFLLAILGVNCLIKYTHSGNIIIRPRH